MLVSSISAAMPVKSGVKKSLRQDESTINQQPAFRGASVIGGGTAVAAKTVVAKAAGMTLAGLLGLGGLLLGIIGLSAMATDTAIKEGSVDYDDIFNEHRDRMYN